MALLDFQTALGRLVRVHHGDDALRGLVLTSSERHELAGLIETPGFRFTVEVQRSWCKGRAAKAAWLTLSILPPEERERLLDEWVSRGGGAGSFFAGETAAFLDFVAERLPAPSHALSFCRMEQATLLASQAANRFAPPEWSRLDTPGCVLRRGRYATLVRFHAELRLLFAALAGGPLPPISPEVTPILFAPGLDGLFRVATPVDVNLWERIIAPVAFTELLQQGHPREAVEAFFLAGAAESCSV